MEYLRVFYASKPMHRNESSNVQVGLRSQLFEAEAKIKLTCEYGSFDDKGNVLIRKGRLCHRSGAIQVSFVLSCDVSTAVPQLLS